VQEDSEVVFSDITVVNRKKVYQNHTWLPKSLLQNKINVTMQEYQKVISNKHHHQYLHIFTTVNFHKVEEVRVYVQILFYRYLKQFYIMI
jgi:hypothetical protein